MKPIYFLLALFLFIGCKKVDDYKPQYPTYTAPDFELIPTKDAKWHVHMVYDDGYDLYPPASFDLESVKDHLSKFDVYITATGRDTIINSMRFYIYQFTETSTPPDLDTIYQGRQYKSYLRQDINTLKVYFDDASVLLDFSDAGNNGQIRPFYTWREMDISNPDSVILAGYCLKRWNMHNVYDPTLQYFYKGIGIGTYMGLLPVNAYNHSIMQVTSLDFTYKGDSVHFEYPLQ